LPTPRRAIACWSTSVATAAFRPEPVLAKMLEAGP
jgi:hypothetical protein